ncbi:MAG: methionine--tRNA ligase [Rectinema sp.]|nr:methionine--tRNA ligase [Rectinema sp.]
MKRRLVTSALPYVNNVPHLGNLIQVLSADVFARFCRLRGYETLYICGTDEYGTATETKALEEGVTPRELCDRFHILHRDIYAWFEIAFDKFGRTSTPEHTEITQSIFLDLDNNGYITQQSMEQLYCDSCGRFLADRYVRGTCPHCGYEGARGDQCEMCGKLLDPMELLEPKCSTCSGAPRPRSTTHLYIDLPRILPRLESWMKEASVKGFWANNAIQMTQAWIRDGLHPRAITRDLKWGIPVPKKGFEDKVFYVWFDAPIGYISMTACLASEKGFDWKEWWQNPEEVELFQFIGKDNIPFHTVIFPSSLLGSGRNWTMLHHMSSTEYLNYEAGKFSKSKGIGVFGTDAMETGIPADVWRFYIFWNRPETSDYTFTWSDFQEKVNGELIGNLGNLVNRTLTFVSRYYEGKIPEADSDSVFWEKVQTLEKQVTEYLERADLRDAFRTIFAIADLANKRFQDEEPWKTRTTDPARAARLMRDLCLVLKDLAIMLHPYVPRTAERLAKFLGFSIGMGAGMYSWQDLGLTRLPGTVSTPEMLFSKLEDENIAALRLRYSGSQKERAEVVASQQASAAPAAEVLPEPSGEQEPVESRFSRLIDLRVARIIKVERHPKADKLYIETLDDGSGAERVIVSGLVPYYSAEELLGKQIILVNNLKPATLRGVKSAGMLLAASAQSPDGKELVEVLEAPNAEPGDRVCIEGMEGSQVPVEIIDIDTFFSIPLRAQEGFAMAGNGKLAVNGTPVVLSRVQNGSIG